MLWWRQRKSPGWTLASDTVFTYIFPPYCLGRRFHDSDLTAKQTGSWRLLDHGARTALLQNLHFPLLGSSSSQSGWSFENQRDRLYCLCHYQSHLNETECIHTTRTVYSFNVLGQMVKSLLAIWVQSLGQEDPLEKGKATHSSILAWRIARTEEPGSPWSLKESDTADHSTAQLIYNVVLFLGIQQSVPIIHLHVSILFQILFPYRLLQSTEFSCWEVPYWLSYFIYIVVFIC